MPKPRSNPLGNPFLRGDSRKYIVAVIAIIAVMVIAALCSLYRASHEGVHLFLFNRKTVPTSQTAPSELAPHSSSSQTP